MPSQSHEAAAAEPTTSLIQLEVPGQELKKPLDRRQLIERTGSPHWTISATGSSVRLRIPIERAAGRSLGQQRWTSGPRQSTGDPPFLLAVRPSDLAHELRPRHVDAPIL